MKRNNNKKEKLVSRKNIVNLFSAVLLSLMLFTFCSRPKEVMTRKQMERVMYDIYIAEAMIENDYSNFNTPEKKEALINEIFKKHKTNQAQWDTSLSWYSDKIDIYLKMNDSVRSRLKRDMTALDQIVNRQVEMEQSVSDRSILSSNIPSFYSFSEVNPKNGFRFKLDSATIASTINDSLFYFTFETIGVSEIIPPRLKSMLKLEYRDTTIYRTDTILGNDRYIINLQKFIPNDTLRTLTGFIRLQNPIGSHRYIQLNNIRLGSKNDTVHQNQSDSIQLSTNDTIIDKIPDSKKIRKVTEHEIQMSE